jgi:hypothetical protein
VLFTPDLIGLNKLAIARVYRFASRVLEKAAWGQAADPYLMQPLGEVLFISRFGRLNRHKYCLFNESYEVQIGCSWAGFFAALRLASLLLL